MNKQTIVVEKAEVNASDERTLMRAGVVDGNEFEIHRRVARSSMWIGSVVIYVNGEVVDQENVRDSWFGNTKASTWKLAGELERAMLDELGYRLRTAKKVKA